MPSLLNDENAPSILAQGHVNGNGLGYPSKHDQPSPVQHASPKARLLNLANSNANTRNHIDASSTLDGHSPSSIPPADADANDTFDAHSARSHSTNNTSINSTWSTRGHGTGYVNGGGEVSDITAMSSHLPNGGLVDDKAEKETEKEYDVAVTPNKAVTRKPLPNGNSPRSTPPDRAPPPPPTNGIQDGGYGFEGTFKDAQPRSSIASTGAGSIQPSPVEMPIRQVNRAEITTMPDGSAGAGNSTSAFPRIPSSGQSSTPLTNQAGPLPETPSPGTQIPGSTQQVPHQTSPKHFSSPAVYQNGVHASSAPFPSSTAQPASGPGSLKHRHTLEVPRSGPRGSRDDADPTSTGGRFSPTVANPSGGSIRRASLSLVRRNTRSLHSDLPRDEVVPDEDARRWAEAYRQKRASKKRRLEQEDDDRVLVGTKVDESHANFATAYNMLTGIRVSVSRTNAKVDRPLTPADFDAKQKSTFDIAGNELVPSAKYDFKFKDYAPWVFRHLRTLFRLDPADYLMSLTGKYILSELGSPGKSGSFFYFSRDYKYIIKTIHHAEHKFLRRILKDYYDHVTENPNTLLSQFYGLHRVKIPYGKKIHFVVMNNLFPPHRDIHQTFDLKGSTIGRDFKEEELEKKPRAVLKDLNWLRRQQHLELGLEKKRLFLEQLQSDVRLLQRLGIMDYSLLIGVHDLRRGNEEKLRDKTLTIFNPGGEVDGKEGEPAQSVLMRTPSKLENARKARELRQMIKSERPRPIDPEKDPMLDTAHIKDSLFYKDDGGLQATHEDNSPGEEIYYLGVIDCLTHYGMIKKIEHFWKGLSHDKTQISAVPPQPYGERFLNFMSGITMSPEEAGRDAQHREQVPASATATATTSPVEGPASKGKESERIASWASGSRPVSQIPPIPEHPPPPPPGLSPGAAMTSSPAPISPYASGQKSPEIEDVMRKAEHQAAKSPLSEKEVPDMVRTTTKSPDAIVPAAAIHPPSPTEHRDATFTTTLHAPSASQTGLPVVEEAGEGSSVGGRSAGRVSQISSSIGDDDTDSRPLTPAKDGTEMGAGFGNPMMYHSERGHRSQPEARATLEPPRLPPPSPPKAAGSYHLKPESADSGYGVSAVSGGGRARSGTAGTSGTGGSSGSVRGVKGRISRESLDKALPPLPRPQ